MVLSEMRREDGAGHRRRLGASLYQGMRAPGHRQISGFLEPTQPLVGRLTYAYPRIPTRKISWLPTRSGTTSGDATRALRFTGNICSHGGFQRTRRHTGPTPARKMAPACKAECEALFCGVFEAERKRAIRRFPECPPPPLYGTAYRAHPRAFPGSGTSLARDGDPRRLDLRTGIYTTRLAGGVRDPACYSKTSRFSRFIITGYGTGLVRGGGRRFLAQPGRP